MNLTESQSKAVTRALNILDKHARHDRVPFTGAALAKDYFRLLLAPKTVEVFAVAYLDSQHKLIACEQEATGTIDGAAVYPRNIAKRALLLDARCVILAHNHPSGTSEPSEADKAITYKIKESLMMLDIQTLDHMIVGDSVLSFAEKGII